MPKFWEFVDHIINPEILVDIGKRIYVQIIKLQMKVFMLSF